MEPLVWLHPAASLRWEFASGAGGGHAPNGTGAAAAAGGAGALVAGGAPSDAALADAVAVAQRDAREAEVVADLRKQVSALRQALDSAMAVQAGKSAGRGGGAPAGKSEAANLLAVDCHAAEQPGAPPVVRVGLLPWQAGGRKTSAADQAASKKQVSSQNKHSTDKHSFRQVIMFALDYANLPALPPMGALAPTAPGLPLAMGGRLVCTPVTCDMLVRYAKICAGLPSPEDALGVFETRGLEVRCCRTHARCAPVVARAASLIHPLALSPAPARAARRVAQAKPDHAAGSFRKKKPFDEESARYHRGI